MFLGWLAYLKKPIAVIVDVLFTFNHFLVALTYFTKNFSSLENLQNSKYCIALALVTLWFLRLGGFIFKDRVLRGYNDPRYEIVAGKAKSKRLFFLIHYQFQGIVALVTSSPLYFVFNSTNPAWTTQTAISAIIAFLAFVGEWQADSQLQQFKDSNQKQGEICKIGWWRKSRHPNLFFELVFWFAMASMGVADELHTFSGFVGPIILFLIMDRLTIPLTEKHMMKSKPEFPAYKSKTNKYWPF